MEPDQGPSRVSGVRADTDAGLAEVYAAACPRLIGYLTVLTGNRADAEEIAQDAFVQALRNWSRIQHYDDIVGWLHQVATRMAISRGRRASVARRGLLRLRAQAVELVDHAPEAGLDLDDALARLPVDHRAVLLLHHSLDLPVAEIARALDLPEGTVKSRLARARAALQPLVDDPRSAT